MSEKIIMAIQKAAGCQATGVFTESDLQEVHRRLCGCSYVEPKPQDPKNEEGPKMTNHGK